jgi:hypothetical protein
VITHLLATNMQLRRKVYCTTHLVSGEDLPDSEYSQQQVCHPSWQWLLLLLLLQHRG